ncbi:MAG: lysophospholipid acyltransferase family protein [Candidatus Eisenbacteria bacterium]|nr:lysophospholipid acyltransferase family protein [Candidatus Eisenbacteria bacterium]
MTGGLRQWFFDRVLGVFGYLLYEVGGALALIIHVSVSYTIASGVADLNFAFNTRSRRAVIANLRRVLGKSVDEAEMTRVAKRTFRNFALSIVDFLRFPILSRKSLTGMVDGETLAVIRRELESGKGVILLGAHVGNWEVGGAMLARSGIRLSAVALPHRNRLIDRFFVKRRRSKGINVVSSRRAASELLAALRRNECVAILGDRNVVGSGVRREFFGSPAVLPYGYVALALRTGAAIVPTFAVREKGSRFRLCVEEPIRPGAGATAFEDVLSRSLRALEKCVREYPDQWFAFEPIWQDGRT